VRYDLLALLIVFAIPFAAIGLVVAAYAWGRDAIERSRAAGIAGVGLTVLAAVNLLVARGCGSGVNRPVITMVLGDDACHRVGLLSFELLLLLVVATSVVVRLPDVRR
jgi:hypothetical protein